MKIKVATIDKGGKDKLYTPLIEHFLKISRPFATIEVIDIFNKSIIRGHEEGVIQSKHSYSEAFANHFSANGVNIALDPNGIVVDSFDIAKILKDKNSVTFFIGGAYGLEESFVQQCNKCISFGKITLSHKLAKVVLLEQIFRALAINNNHPYHK
ncbi:MAG TPA: 23S rRNA (pseudouridine(1915)-N(3))-methyltransferase RlmH [Epsilonproteobacteria bacterium]|nr:23S rRNA (pseudouridine(1915)-N(3))-methyltransferase RlmH [Campylobacterota bacterium]